MKATRNLNHLRRFRSAEGKSSYLICGPLARAGQNDHDEERE